MTVQQTEMSLTTVVAYGEALWDLLPSGPAVLGGAPLNFAYRINSLAFRFDNWERQSQIGKAKPPTLSGRRPHQ